MTARKKGAFPANAGNALQNVAAVPDVDTLKDEELPMLFDMADSRQLIHITYGFVLSHPIFRPALDQLWDKECAWYAALLKVLRTMHMECLRIPYVGRNARLDEMASGIRKTM